MLVFLHKKINVRLLFGAHLFERRDMLVLFFAHLFEGGNALTRPHELGLKHAVVLTDGLCDHALPLQLLLQSLDMVQVNLSMGQTVVDSVGLRD